MSYPGSNIRVALYDSSLFGGTRAHQDLAIFERLHDYPGLATAYDTDAYGFDSDGVVGTATHMPLIGAIRLSLSNAVASKKARLRSHDVVRYQPGCMPVVQTTGAASSNVGMTLRCIRRTFTSGVAVDNEEAVITGYDTSMDNRYEIRYAYLGVQTVLYFINGTLVRNSTFAGNLHVPYMRTPHLPVSTELQTLADGSQVIRTGVFDDEDGLFFEWSHPAGSAGALSYDYKCASGRLVGGSVYPYATYGTSATKAGVTATRVPIMSIRPSALYNGLASRIQVFPSIVSFFAATQAGSMDLILNPTSLTGATWAATSPSGGVQLDTAATALVGGTSIWRVTHGQNQQNTYDLDKLFNLIGRKLRRQAFTGTEDVLTLAVQRETVNFDPRVSLVWNELR